MSENTTKFTPGPWSISPRVSTLVLAANERGVCTTGGYSNNMMDPEVLYSENEANARLIAASPALLAALQETLACLKAWSAGRGPHDATTAVVERAQAAIASATGQP